MTYERNRALFIHLHVLNHIRIYGMIMNTILTNVIP